MIFDPILIVLQIVALQCLFYLSMGTLLGIFHAIFDIKVSLDHFFTSKFINFTSYVGWIETITAALSAIAGAYLLSLIVEKSKKCVDFTFTLFVIHIVICTFYFEFPLEWEWWLINVISSVLMASLGEYICSRNELEDIPLYTTSSWVIKFNQPILVFVGATYESSPRTTLKVGYVLIQKAAEASMLDYNQKIICVNNTLCWITTASRSEQHTKSYHKYTCMI